MPTWTNMLRAKWSGVVVFDTKSGKEESMPNTFAWKHLHVIGDGGGTYQEMQAHARKVFIARQLIHTQPNRVDKLRPGEQRIIQRAGGVKKLKSRLGKTKPKRFSTVIVTSQKGFLEMDAWVADHAKNGVNHMPVLNGAILTYDDQSKQVVSSKSLEVKVSIKQAKDGKKHVYHFDGTGDDGIGGVKSGFSSWEDHEDDAQMIPWWMFG